MSTVTRNLITQSRETHNNALLQIICEEVFPEVVALNQKDVNTKYINNIVKISEIFSYVTSQRIK
jgi:hypothetical protein